MEDIVSTQTTMRRLNPLIEWGVIYLFHTAAVKCVGNLKEEKADQSPSRN